MNELQGPYARLRQSQKEREREREREEGGGRWKGRVIVASQQRAKWRIMVHERGNS